MALLELCGLRREQRREGKEDSVAVRVAWSRNVKRNAAPEGVSLSNYTTRRVAAGFRGRLMQRYRNTIATKVRENANECMGERR